MSINWRLLWEIVSPTLGRLLRALLGLLVILCWLMIVAAFFMTLSE